MRRRAIVTATVCLCGILLAPGRTLAGAWTQPEGTLWTKVSVFYLDSDRIFVDAVRARHEECEGRPLEPGDRTPYDCTLEGGGGLRTTQMFFDAALGLHERVDVRLQVPVILNGEVKNAFVDDNNRGLGDIRFGTQVLVLPEPVVASVSVEAKAPTGEFTIDAVSLPLGEGQWDLTFRALMAKSFLDGRMWAGLEAGYRVRFDNDEARPPLDIGDEVVGAVDVGSWPLQWMYAQVRTELTWGFLTTGQGGPLGAQDVSETRRVILEPKIMIAPFRHLDSDAAKDFFKSFGVEWGVRVPVWGRNWPVEPAWFVGVSNTFRLFSPYSRDDA